MLVMELEPLVEDAEPLLVELLLMVKVALLEAVLVPMEPICFKAAEQPVRMVADWMVAEPEKSQSDLEPPCSL